MDKCTLAAVAIQIQSTIHNTATIILHIINNTATQYSTHPILFQTEITPLTFGGGFLLGIILGLRN